MLKPTAILVLISSVSICFAQDDLSKQRQALEKQLLDYTLASNSTEATFADEIAELKRQIEALNKKLNAPNLEQTNHGWFSGFLHTQFTSIQSNGNTTADFRNRRTRLIYNHIGDSRTLGRFSVEFNTGVNQTSAQVRDAFIQYKPATYLAKSGPSYTIGQQNTPLGYEISYASFARTWPERALYNQTYHAGERGRGVLYQNGDSSNYWFAGLWSSLTVNDIEAVTNTRGPAGETGPVAGVHVKAGAWEGGLSAISTRRPRFVSGATDLATDDRKFSYFDLRYHPTKSKFDLRSEVMRGKDRIPGQNYLATETGGYHVSIDYKLNKIDTFVLRHEEWDADTSLSGGLTTLNGIAYIRDVSQFLRLSVAWQWNTQLGQATGTPANAPINSIQQLTLRAQFKF
ncbi:MAG: hypothetical protein WCK51_07845 [Armatimonadota bacterium]